MFHSVLVSMEEADMKKILILLFSFLLIFSINSQQKSPIKIGFIGPLTGDYANYGKLMTQAIKIAVEERNAKGGIDGHLIELIAEDDEGKVDKANAAIEKLSSRDKIWGFVGAVFSSSSLAIAPRAETEKIVMITPSSTNKALTGDKKFVFRNVLSDALQAKVFAKYVAEVLKIKKVAILYMKNDYSQGLASDFKSQFESDGGTITAYESGMQGDKDFKTQLTKIKGTNPEAIYMPDYVAEMAQILEQSKQLGIKANFLSADGMSNPEIFGLAGDLSNGVTMSNSADESKIGASQIRKSFEDKYNQKWKEKPDSFSLNSYDAANIIVDSIEKAYNDADKSGKDKLALDRDKIRAYVSKVSNYNGVSGVITFLPNGDAIKNVGIFKVDTKAKAYNQIAIYKIDEKGKLVEVK
jgi:branched-chain amino acid transport system substrate-binding protein